MPPRIRTLKPDNWADVRVGRVSRDARLLRVVLITLADDEGRWRHLPSAIIGHGYPRDEDVGPQEIGAWSGELQEAGLILLYAIDGEFYGCFPKWDRHQKIDRATPSALPAPLDEGSTSPRRGLDEGSMSTRRQRGVVDIHRDREQKTDTSSSTSLRAGSPNPNVAFLCRLLADSIVGRDPKAKPARDSQRWATDMRLLLKDRENDVVEVEKVIRWSQADPFWASNILSPTKLRKQFVALRGKMLKATTPQEGESNADFAARLNRTAGQA